MPSTCRVPAAPDVDPAPPAKRPRTRPGRQADRESEPRCPPERPTDPEDNQDEDQDKEDDTEEEDQAQDIAREREPQRRQETFRCPFSVPRKGVRYLCEGFGDNGRKTKASVGSLVVLLINSRFDVT